MKRYYCPYCSPHYKFFVEDDQKLLNCIKCGEPLTKIPFVKIKQIAALSILIGFVSPLLLYFINELRKNFEIKPTNKYEDSIELVRK